MDLFRKKSPDHLIAEAAAPDRQMKRALGPFALTCIGIGAIIGTGIFALAGTAAAGEQIQASIWKTPITNFVQAWWTHAPLVFGRPGAGPAVMLSFVLAGVACGFAALCYAALANALGSVERAHLVEALRQTGGNVTRAAARLGISRDTLRYRMTKHGLG